MSKYICNFEPFVGLELGLTKGGTCNNRYLAAQSKISECPNFYCYATDLPSLIRRGLITEVKPAVWTDDDMIEFRHRCFAIPENTCRNILADFKKEKGL